MSAAAEFIDAALQYEGSWERAADDRARLGRGAADYALEHYGASVGAVRGTVRDALRKFPGLDHDEVTALASELWATPVFERRLAAVVLLQSGLGLLRASDLTRIEGFVRSSRLRELVDPLAVDVVGPLVDSLAGSARGRADTVLDRWLTDDPWLGRAAVLAPLGTVRRREADGGRLLQRLERLRSAASDDPLLVEAVETVTVELAKRAR